MDLKGGKQTGLLNGQEVEAWGGRYQPCDDCNPGGGGCDVKGKPPRELQLAIDALFLGLGINQELKLLEGRGQTQTPRFQRLLELGGRAWGRFKRRRAQVRL